MRRMAFEVGNERSRMVTIRSRVTLTCSLCLTFGALMGLASSEDLSQIGPDDTAYWMSLKQKPGNRPGRLAASNQDVATNVRAQQDEGTKIVSVWYDAEYQNGWPVNVSLQMNDNGSPVPCQTYLDGSDVGLNIPSGRGKLIRWNAGADWNGKLTSNMTATVVAVPSEHPSTYASITVMWSEFGGRDLDICGYWTDRSDVKVGWSWGYGSTGAEFESVWEGDNTGSGPEYIHIGVKPGQTLAGGSGNRTYRVHCNYYGSSNGSAKARIKVDCAGKSMSKTISTSNRNGSKATTSDPYVTITFDAAGNLLSVN